MNRILDAWAVLAWLQDERPASIQVQKMLEKAEAGLYQLGVGIINVGEVFYRLARMKGEDEAYFFLKDLRSMPLTILGVPRPLVIQAATLKSKYPISYADAFAVATALREQATLVTGDPELGNLRKQGIVRILWIGRPG
jgi:predicted nucleic acid-binding protein